MYFLTAAARIGADLPNVNSPGCKNDKFCSGLFSGCTSSAVGATCEPKTTSCGPAYVDGWTGKLCTAGFAPGEGEYSGNTPGSGNGGALQSPPSRGSNSSPGLTPFDHFNMVVLLLIVACLTD